MPAVVPFIPLIASGIGAVGGGVAAKMAQKGALKRSPEEQVSLAGATQSAGRQEAAGAKLLDTAGSLSTQGKQWLDQPASYYKTLLSGNRAAQANAVAAPTAAITDVYRGAERNLERSGVRGAAKDVAASELGRSRASQIAGLTTGVQDKAAGDLAGLGNAVMSQAPGVYGAGANLMGNAGTIYSGLLGQGYENRMNAESAGKQTGQVVGGLARDAATAVGGVFNKPGIPTIPSRTLPGTTGAPSRFPIFNTGPVPVGPGSVNGGPDWWRQTRS